ncbi:tigger transposable element-derived protein 6-like [Dermacentor albipictus]|uniref:tigger transposable element-derived protein 6-like n=1 Tax=Dermacentor albipictus TaxID=60249 RepID=UPI0038FD2D89
MSLLQPLDEGIIKSVKAEFHKHFVQRFIINFCLKQPTAVNIRLAAEMLTGAWWNLKASTISNCWRKAGLVKAPVQLGDDLEVTNNNPGDLWTDVVEQLPTVSSFDNYVEGDSAALNGSRTDNQRDC